MSTLTLVSHRHDLPPKWDGVPVEWDDWNTGRSTIIYHAKPEDLACDKCGLIEEKQHTWGKRPRDGETVTVHQIRKTKKSGREYTVPVEAPAWPIYDLSVARCRGCGHDTVHDHRTDEHWDLDPSDYGDTGSTDTKDTLW